MGTTEKLYYFYGSYSVQPSARLHRKRGIWPRMQCWWLLTQSLELARARMTPANSRAKQMKQSLSFVKTFVQRVTFSVAVITTLQELLRVEAADPGTDLLAEYVASRCGIKLRSSLFLKKADPVWHVRRGRSAVTTPLLLEDARQITFCHRVTQEKVKGLVGDLFLLPKR